MITSINGILASGGVQSSLMTGLYSAYILDANLNDSLGTYNGTIAGTETYTTGKINNGLSLNGTSYFSLGTDTHKFTSDFSFTFWIKLSSLATTCYPVSNYQTPGVQRGWRLGIAATGNVSFSAYNGGTNILSMSSANSTITTGKWYNITVKFVASGSCAILVNGISVATGASSGACNYTTSTYPTIGASKYTSVLVEGQVNGVMDAVTFWSRAITTDETDQVYSGGDGQQYPYINVINISKYLANVYKAESNATDSIASNNGTAQGGLTYTTGISGNAFLFNGTNAYVSLPDNSMNLTGDWTISLWVYSTSGLAQCLFDNLAFTSGSVYKGWQLDINNIGGGQSGKITFSIPQGPGSSTGTFWQFNTTTLTNNAWNHIVLTRVSGVNSYCWVNNTAQGYTLSGTGANIATDPTYHTTQYVTLGANKLLNGTVGNYLKNGSELDEIYVYSRALTDSERAKLYNSGAGKFYPTF